MKPKKSVNLTSLLLILQFLFLGLSLAGAAYVVLQDGEPSAGFAVIPMVFSLVFGHFYRRRKNRPAK